jgi:hypothetical protein
MKKIVLLVKRKAGLTPAQFRDEYERCHVPLALRLLPGIKHYRRNYVRHDLAYRPPKFESAPLEPSFDVITEMTFDTDVDYQRMISALEDPAIQAQIAEDGKRFMNRASMQMFFVDEEVTAPGG